MKSKIHKIKLKDGCAIIDYDEVTDEGKTIEVSKKFPFLITDDFKKAMDRFKAHLVKICDMRESTIVGDEISGFDPEELEDIRITGVSISGTDDHEGVVIIAQKTIGNKVLNLVSPFTKFTDEHDAYVHEHELYEDAVHLAYEAELYMFEGKYAVKQLELFGEDTQDLD